MSDGRHNLAGSAARSHEQTGGNAPAGPTPLPAGGDAARKAEAEGESINEAHGIRTVPRGQYRGSMQLHLPRAVGARMAPPEAPPPDLSRRKASDYLPPALKAQLIAEGRLTPEGDPVPAPAPARAVTTPDAGPAPAAASSGPAVAGPPAPAPSLARRLLGRLFPFLARRRNE